MGLIIIAFAVLFLVVAIVPKGAKVSKWLRVIVIVTGFVCAGVFSHFADKYSQAHKNTEVAIVKMVRNDTSQTYEIKLQNGEKLTLPFSTHTVQTSASFGFAQSLKTEYIITSPQWYKILFAPLNTYEKQRTLYLNEK